MNRRRRRPRTPKFAYDPRASGESPRLPPDYDGPYNPSATPFEPTQSMPAFVEPHLQQQYPISGGGYREYSLPSTYRATLREPYPIAPAAGPAPYKILCITNINPKVGDGPVKDALASDFSRFGDVSVSICHDSGERLAYIYFRTYEEAREARHTKTRTLFFDRALEIEPIYEPRSSPTNSPPPPSLYNRRRSITPPDYYGINGPPQPPLGRRPPPPPPPPPNRQPPQQQPLPPPMPSHHRVVSPPPNCPHPSSRYPPGPPPQMPPMPYGGRYYLPPSHLPPPSPPHDSPYRSYPPPPPPSHYPPGQPYHNPSPYGPTMARERERCFNEIQAPARSPRHEAYYSMDQRSAGYSPHSSRASLHSSSSSHHHLAFVTRRSPPPPHPDHPRYMSREFRREKYGSETYNINEPEEGRPSRVLYITNVDPAKSESEVREVFESFGVIEDIEVRKINSEISSALIKFTSMDCAYKAKTATNGKYLGSKKCRIIYGKVSASRRLWIGGLGVATTTAHLEGEFGKFGTITSLDYTAGRPYAYVEFESANQAQFATHHLRGTFVCEAERKLRIEYVDPVDRGDKTKPESNVQASDISSRSSRRANESWNANEHEASPKLNSLKRSITPTEVNNKRVAQVHDHLPPKNTKNEPHNPTKVSPNSSSEQESAIDKNELNNNQQLGDRAAKVSNESDQPGLDRLVQSKSIREIVDCCSISWFSQLVLRNFNFPSKIFMCSGRKTIIEKYITKLNGENGQDNCSILRITQRWRLHPQPKLEEVKRRMQSGNLGMLIITSRPDQSLILSSPTSCKTPQISTSNPSALTKQNGDEAVDTVPVGGEAGCDKTTAADVGGSSGNESPSVTQSRPLKNLISYLEQKDAAGVISLSALDRGYQADGSKLLYAFPPGDFALNLLKRKAPNLTLDAAKEEFLLGVIVGGADTKI